MIEFEESTGNVYADLAHDDADAMLLKAQPASKIHQIIKTRQWTQQQAAAVLMLPQSKLSNILRGQFRAISEARMPDGLRRPGRDAQIVISPAQRSAEAGQIAVAEIAP